MGVFLLVTLIDIKSMLLCELEEDFIKNNIKKYRAKQIYEWLQRGAQSFDEMTNVPSVMRKNLEQIYYINSIHIEAKFVSQKDGTIKYLFRLFDNNFIESVLMKYKYGYTVCISTQAGCKMGCAFCATGKDNFSRNLFPSEMLSQIQEIQKDNGIRISHVVMMGMGEPLDNYENSVKFLKLVSSPDNLNIGMRHISLSTCGIVDKILLLAEENFQLTLSISLHAPNDELRSKIMPINRKWGINQLIGACKEYIKKTGRRISFEYAMIDSFNDSKGSALELSNLLKGILCHVNLIPVNSIDGDEFKKSNRNRVRSFQDILIANGINATVRRTLGPDINASCGQLRQRTQHKKGASK